MTALTPISVVFLSIGIVAFVLAVAPLTALRARVTDERVSLRSSSLAAISSAGLYLVFFGLWLTMSFNGRDGAGPYVIFAGAVACVASIVMVFRSHSRLRYLVFISGAFSGILWWLATFASAAA